MKILIISGGSLNFDFAKKVLQCEGFDKVIAADKGLFYCDRLGIRPDYIIGDFDSLLDKELLKSYGLGKVELSASDSNQTAIYIYPEKKDASDTELAIELALSLKPEKVVMLACTGSRYDHSLANIGLLLTFVQSGVEAVIMDEHNEIRLYEAKNDPLTVSINAPSTEGYRNGDDMYCSFIPWTEEVCGVTLKGFEYPLTDHTMCKSSSLCVSNRLIDKKATISFTKGKLLVIKAWD